MNRLSVIACLGLPLLFSLPAAGLDRELPTGALADYVEKKDDSYGWFKRSEGSVLTCRYAELILTSQTWRGIPWKHQLFILKPAQVDPAATHALLMIAGGNWNDKLADPGTVLKLPGEAQLLALLAEQLKVPVAILLQVPEEPLFDGKREDQLIAYTFREFLKTGDSTWPLLEPMTKSAVRAMDATQEAVKKEFQLDVATFTITGASKRGWTTWLTGAVDRRAVAIAPMVINMLNMSPHLKLQRASFGGEPSEQIDAYRGLDKFIDTPRGAELRKIVDPWEYRRYLTQPKLIILGTNDRYWPLDACGLYWNDLVGEKYLIYVPNNGHDLRDRARVIAGIEALNRRVITGQPLPKLEWKFEDRDKQVRLDVTSDVRPSRVKIWSARSATRDFRDSEWTETEAIAADGKFMYEQPVPASGYAAFFGEAIFKEGTEKQFWLSTNVRMISSQEETAGGK